MHIVRHYFLRTTMQAHWARNGPRWLRCITTPTAGALYNVLQPTAYDDACYTLPLYTTRPPALPFCGALFVLAASKHRLLRLLPQTVSASIFWVWLCAHGVQTRAAMSAPRCIFLHERSNSSVRTCAHKRPRSGSFSLQPRLWEGFWGGRLALGPAAFWALHLHSGGLRSRAHCFPPSN